MRIIKSKYKHNTYLRFKRYYKKSFCEVFNKLYKDGRLFQVFYFGTIVQVRGYNYQIEVRLLKSFGQTWRESGSNRGIERQKGFDYMSKDGIVNKVLLSTDTR